MPPSTAQPAEHVDAVVVGSGFGGAVAAYRLAEGGRSVVVLERGGAWPPGSFPRSPRELGRSFWAPDDGLHGLFDVWSFDGLESVVSSGLGGGSLIYANVLLRKDENWFVHADPLPGGGYESWPVTRADLDPHYDAVERMLTPAPFPVDAAPFDATAKTREFRGAAEALGLEWQLPPLAVSFAPRPGAEPAVGVALDEPEYGNVHGVPRRTCRLTGACDIGCNDGAKNTLDHTYLSAAAHHGAQLRTLCQVRTLRADERGYVVDYLDRGVDGADGAQVERRITADRVVLGAGTLGTTHLLLRNRAGLPALGPALGTRFCGNGDLLSVLTPGERPVVFDASRGPVITGAIRVPDAADGGDGRGFYVQDGGYPDFVDWIADVLGSGRQARAGSFLARWLTAPFRSSSDPNLSGEMASLIGDGALSSGSLPLLGMGRDVPDGAMTLDERGRLAVDWTTASSEDYFRRVQETMDAVSGALGTTLRVNPLSFLRRVVTVHPLGGAPMGHDPSSGVCDAHGEVFGHPGLYIADGAAMPGPIGPNPALTIAAHADRVATAILSGRTSGVRRAPAAPAPDAPEPSGLSFSEQMHGHIAPGATDPDEGADAPDARAASVDLTITIPDVDAFIADPDHRAPVTGAVHIGDARHDVRDGSFQLFVPGPGAGDRRMVYRLPFTDGDGERRTLLGVKDVHDDPGIDVWADTTTLRCTLHRDGGGDSGAAGPGGAAGPDDTAGTGGAAGTDNAAGTDGPVAGAGVLRLGAADLLRQLTTFRPSGPDGPAALLRFGRMFLGELWDTHGPHARTDASGIP